MNRNTANLPLPLDVQTLNAYQLKGSALDPAEGSAPGPRYRLVPHVRHDPHSSLFSTASEHMYNNSRKIHIIYMYLKRVKSTKSSQRLSLSCIVSNQLTNDEYIKF